jgi:hypothetical protein
VTTAAPALEPEPEPEPAPLLPPEPAESVISRAVPAPLTAMDRLAAHPASTHTSLQLRAAWVASLVLLVLAAGAAYGWRSQIVAVWPPSARAYALFGLQPETQIP